MKAVTKGSPDTWSKAETLDRLGGDEGLLQELIEIFVNESPKQLRKLRGAIEHSDAEATMRLAHSIKGELACLGGAAATAAAQEIETMGKNRELSGAAQALARLESEVVALKLFLRDPTHLQS